MIRTNYQIERCYRDVQKRWLLLLFGVLLMTSCSNSGNGVVNTTQDRKPQKKTHFTYLALGDSYTIGESVEPEQRWPAQLATRLSEKGMNVRGPLIIAKTGWRTDDMLHAAQSELKKEDQFDIVTLLIGVNNEYQGWNPENFKPEFRQCLDYAVSKCKRGNAGVFVVSIPDYGYTPFGKDRQTKISPRIDAYNQICKTISAEKDITFYDITPISRTDKTDSSLVADDGLHPSGKQYGLWVKSFADKMYDQLVR